MEKARFFEQNYNDGLKSFAFPDGYSDHNHDHYIYGHEKHKTPTHKLLNAMYRNHILKRGQQNKIKLSGKKLKINGCNGQKGGCICIKYSKWTKRRLFF